MISFTKAGGLFFPFQILAKELLEENGGEVDCSGVLSQEQQLLEIEGLPDHETPLPEDGEGQEVIVDVNDSGTENEDYSESSGESSEDGSSEGQEEQDNDQEKHPEKEEKVQEMQHTPKDSKTVSTAGSYVFGVSEFNPFPTVNFCNHLTIDLL